MIALKALQKLALACPRWTLRYADSSLYLARWVLWGVDCLENHDSSLSSHAFLHEICTSDGDRHMHNHPWSKNVALVLSGGYTERREGHSGEYCVTYGEGDLNILCPGDYHSIISVEPDTWTLFLCGRETHDWGFLVDGTHVPHKEYFARTDVQRMTHRREA